MEAQRRYEILEAQVQSGQRTVDKLEQALASAERQVKHLQDQGAELMAKLLQVCTGCTGTALRAPVLPAASHGTVLRPTRLGRSGFQWGGGSGNWLDSEDR